MAVINKPTLGGVTLPFPDGATIEPVWYQAEQVTLAGRSRRDVMARKYKYTMKWNYLDSQYYEAMEAITNTISSTTFVYEKWTQSSAGATVIATLSARELTAGAGTPFYSSVTLECIEVDSRI